MKVPYRGFRGGRLSGVRSKLRIENGSLSVILDESTDDLKTLTPYLGTKIGAYENMGVYLIN